MADEPHASLGKPDEYHFGAHQTVGIPVPGDIHYHIYNADS